MSGFDAGLRRHHQEDRPQGRKFTTSDLRFTVETSLPGSERLAPVLMVNDKVWQMTAEAAEIIIDALLKEEGLV